MATVSFPGIFFPTALSNAQSAPSITTTGPLMDAAGELAGYVFRAPKTGSIRKIHFRTGTVTTPTDTDVRLETVDATTGAPTGTLFGTNTNVTVVSGSITTSTWITSGSLTADASVTKGDILAIVIAPTGSPNYRMCNENWLGISPLFNYTVNFASSAWSKTTTTGGWAVEYSDGSFAFIPGSTPASAINTHTINTGTTPDEIALKFTLTAPVRVSGAWALIDADGDSDIVLYDSDGTTVLTSVSVDKDVHATTNPDVVYILFPTSVSLTTGVAYRLAIKPTSATSLSGYSLDVAAAGILDQLSGGQAFHYSQRTDAGAWSDTTTRRPFAGLIIDGLDDGTSGGGSSGQRIFGG